LSRHGNWCCRRRYPFSISHAGTTVAFRCRVVRDPRIHRRIQAYRDLMDNFKIVATNCMLMTLGSKTGWKRDSRSSNRRVRFLLSMISPSPTDYRTVDVPVVRSNSDTLASTSSISIALAAGLKIASAARTLIAGVFGSIIVFSRVVAVAEVLAAVALWTGQTPRDGPHGMRLHPVQQCVLGTMPVAAAGSLAHHLKLRMPKCCRRKPLGWSKSRPTPFFGSAWSQ
jgi:hypothetical protein